MIPIQRVAKGLLGLVGSRGTGKNPNEMAQTVQPVVDLSNMYIANDVSIPNQLLTLVNVRTEIAVITVPPGEVWRVLAISLQTNNYTVSQLVRLGIRVAITEGVGSIDVPILWGESPDVVATNDNFDIGVYYETPLVAPAGWQFRGALQNTISGTCNLAIRALVQRLDA